MSVIWWVKINGNILRQFWQSLSPDEPLCWTVILSHSHLVTLSFFDPVLKWFMDFLTTQRVFISSNDDGISCWTCVNDNILLLTSLAFKCGNILWDFVYQSIKEQYYLSHFSSVFRWFVRLFVFVLLNQAKIQLLLNIRETITQITAMKKKLKYLKIQICVCY